jgi:hypothetical protein
MGFFLRYVYIVLLSFFVMVWKQDRDRAISEPIAEILIVILAITCAALIVAVLFGFFSPSNKSTSFAPVTDFSSIDGKAVMRLNQAGEDSIALTTAATRNTAFRMKMVIETRDGLYEVIPDSSLKNQVLPPRGTITIFRAPDSYRFTDTPETLVPAGSIPAGPFSLHLTDETHHATIANLGENGWGSVGSPSVTPAPTAVAEPPASIPVTESATPVPPQESTPGVTAEPTPGQTPGSPVSTPVETISTPVTPDQGSVPTPFPTIAELYPVFLETTKRGYLTEGSILKFKVSGQYSYIRIGSTTKSLSSGDEVVLAIPVSEGAKIQMTESQLNTFQVDDATLTVNGVYAGHGSIKDLYVSNLYDLRSSLTVSVPTDSAMTDFRFNGVQLYSGITTIPITVSGLSPGGPNRQLYVDTLQTSTYIDGAAAGYVLA